MKNYQNIDKLADFLFEASQELKGVVFAGKAVPKNFDEGRVLKALEHEHEKKYFKVERDFLDMMASHGGEIFDDNQTTWQHPPETLKPLVFAHGFKVDNMSGILVTDANEHLKCTLHEV